ncbi:MAG: hypothetical protein GY943_10525 [Chloroflexi bacterium]|nr:hypothetical protein [Chloroflexota bacterium]
MTKLTTIPRLLSPLRRGTLKRNKVKSTVELSPPLALLRQWQSDRLASTHQDLLESQEYEAACRFFLDDIYAPRDFSQRDEDLMQVNTMLKPVMPRPMYRTLIKVIALNELTTNLDNELLHLLTHELGMTDELTAEMYAEAYRRCDNYDERVAQIDLIVDVGRLVNRLLRLPFISLSLRLAHGPAHWAGWKELQDFLEHGFAAFKKMDDVSFFLKLLAYREKMILDKIYAHDPLPFSTDDGRSAVFD